MRYTVALDAAAPTSMTSRTATTCGIFAFLSSITSGERI
jgi:hypothetical protein